MGTLGNAHGCCTAAALSCIQWKAHRVFRRLSTSDIEYLQLQQLQKISQINSHIRNLCPCGITDQKTF